jgi:hypothetical protein
LKNDTLTINIKDNYIAEPPFIEQYIYKNGTKKTIRSAYNTLEPASKKEYGDYNFDGIEDFRQESKKSPYRWDVYIYNATKESFEKDTLLSKFEYFDYNKSDRKLQGYYTVRVDETTRNTYYYQWSFAEQKMVLYLKQVCYSKFPNSESQRCIISKLVNGQWIQTEQFGAE